MPIDGILYPSVAHAASSDNVAIKCSVVDKKLELETMQFVRMEHTLGQPDSFQMVGLDYADTFEIDGTIGWAGSFPSNSLMVGAGMSRYQMDEFRKLLVEELQNRKLTAECAAGMSNHFTKQAIEE